MAHDNKLKVENVVYPWPHRYIKGSEVRGLGPGIPLGMDLYLKEKGKVGHLVQADEETDLDDPGIERFYAQNASSEAGGCRC